MTLADDHTDDDVIIVTEEDIVSTPSAAYAEDDRLAVDDPSASTDAARFSEDDNLDDEDDLDTDDSLAPTVGSSAADDLASEDDEDDEDTEDAEDDGLAAEHSGIADDSPDDNAADDEVPPALAMPAADTTSAADAGPATAVGTSPISLSESVAVPDATLVAAGQATNGQSSAAADAAQSEASWPEIQSLFVDDPRRAVEQAAQVAGAALAALSTAARNREQSLRDGWQSGQPGTEDLRTTLRNYRELARRLSTLAAEL